MRVRSVLAVLAVVLMVAPAARSFPLPLTPLSQDPLGPISDVTAHWRHFQPAAEFCVRPDVFQLSPAGPTVTGEDPACANSGFPPDATGLVKIHVETPELCAVCRRVFIDYTKIPGANAAPYYYSHGHAYLHLTSLNPGYTAEPHAHSPNIKNFTNDKLFVPDGSTQEPVIAFLDSHAIAYAANTAHTVYSVSQGPYYAGRWYVNGDGVRIVGAFLDVQPSVLGRLPGDAALNDIGYVALFYSGEATCPNSMFPPYGDGDGWYGGCVDRFGASAGTTDPFAQ